MRRWRRSGREPQFHRRAHDAGMAVALSEFAAAQSYAGNPKARADKVYNGRMGDRLGTDDGWNFRGRGAVQTTGREDFQRLARATGLDQGARHAFADLQGALDLDDVADGRGVQANVIDQRRGARRRADAADPPALFHDVTDQRMKSLFREHHVVTEGGEPLAHRVAGGLAVEHLLDARLHRAGALACRIDPYRSAMGLESLRAQPRAMLSDLNGHTARNSTRSSSPDRGEERFDTDDVHHAREVVGEHVHRHHPGSGIKHFQSMHAEQVGEAAHGIMPQMLVIDGVVLQIVEQPNQVV
jgi:hypothetical protein